MLLPLPPIVLDGRFDDWANRPPAVIDPVDVRKDAIDLGLVMTDDDASFFHVLVELGRTVNLQRVDGRIVLVLDADGRSETGSTEHGLPGSDLIVTFSPANPKRTDRRGEGAGAILFRDGAWIETSPYAIDLSFAPTVASSRAEVRLGRGALNGLPGAGAPSGSILNGAVVNGKVVFIDPAGTVIDETAVFTHRFAFPATSVTIADAPTDPLARAEGTAFRVVSWNVERGALMKFPERFARVLKALNADVILFEELTDKQPAESVAAWLNEHVPSPFARAAPWKVVFGSGGGDLRTAVASRGPIRPIESLDRVGWCDGAGPQRDVRSSSAVVTLDGKPLLASAVHLKCCGSIDSDEDLTRRAEARALRAAMRALVRSGEVAGVIVGGDLNLVGSGEPLELMTAHLDVDGTDLAIANPLQLDRRTMATWEDPLQPFTPGRLDFMVYSDATIEPRGGFVMDTRDLSPRWLEHHGLKADDTTEASDHLPVVMDVRWR